VGSSAFVFPRSAKHPLRFRIGTSDFDVFRQIFVEREYAPLLGMRDVRLVIDCGANVGYSSSFFLSHYPECHVVAVEPDSGNFALLEQNISPYGQRAMALQAGIWPSDVPLKISSEPYRDGREWSVQVRPCAPDEKPDVQGVSIESLLAATPFSRISILKVDIEGAEAMLFRATPTWLNRVDAIAIELHEDSAFGPATELFHQAIDGHGFTVTRSGELTICQRVGGFSAA
jgi:FkbM family methyltransferase